MKENTQETYFILFQKTATFKDYIQEVFESLGNILIMYSKSGNHDHMGKIVFF